MAEAVEQLVGRTTELESLDHALADLARGEPGALEIVGEPGIGKTRLLAELGARADSQGQLVLSGSASELERDLPFWVFVDALDEYVRGLDPRRLASLDEDDRSELAQVLPSLPASGDGIGAGRTDERYRTHRAVRRLLERLAAAKPLVLLLDDLHWADSGSIELIGSLLRRPPSAAVLIALALRPRPVSERLSGALARADRAGLLTRLQLEPLSADEARELLGAEIGGAVYEESGGNPFYLQQLARAPRGQAEGTHAAGISLAGVEVPPAVVAALAEELALLPGGARRVLEGAAVAGDPFEPDLAAAAAALPEPAAMEALDELLRRDLVRHTEVPRRFRFRHPLVRMAVYEAAPGGWRLGAHERSAEALASRGVPAVERAHHVERCARHGDLDAVAVLREAGESAAQRTPATAARLFGAALRLLPANTPAGERVELLTALAGAHAAAGQFSEAHSAILESIELVPEDAPAGRVTLAATCAGLENLLGRHEDAHTRLMDALEGLPDATSPEAVALMTQLSVDAFYRMDYTSTRDWARRAVELARPLEDRPLIASATGMLTLGSVFDGAVAEAESGRFEAAALIDSMSDDEYALFILSRHRQNMGEGLGPREAAAQATGTAGSAVVFAGATVVIALVGLLVVNIPFLTVMGLAAAAAVVIAVLIATTLLPALLGFFGERVARLNRVLAFRPRGRKPGREAAGVRYARFVTRRPLAVAIACVVGLAVVALPAMHMKLGLPDGGSKPTDNTERQAYDLLSEGFGPAFNGVLTVVVDAPNLPREQQKRLAAGVADELKGFPNVAAVSPPAQNERGDVTIVNVTPKTGPASDETRDLVDYMRAQADQIPERYGIGAYVTGTTALNIDTADTLAAALPKYIAVVVGLALLLLMVVFRSVWVPIKAAAGFLLSIAASMGLVVWVFQDGNLADLFAVAQTGPVVSFLPVLLIGILFGLAMDYEVFLVSRMREAYVHSGDARAAIVTGYGQSGRVVTAAAVIMTGVFAAFLLDPDPVIKSIGLSLAFGVLADAFVVRMTLVPAVMALLGRRAWALPRRLERIVPEVDIEGERLARGLSASASPS